MTSVHTRMLRMANINIFFFHFTRSRRRRRRRRRGRVPVWTLFCKLLRPKRSGCGVQAEGNITGCAVRTNLVAEVHLS